MGGRVGGKVAIVTGAGSGIGNAMARRLAAEGARVVLADIAGAEDAASAIGGEAMAVTVDVSDPEQIEALIARTVERFGRLDILCNNAGRSGGMVPIEDTTTELFDHVHGTNLRGAFLVMQAAIRQMLKNGGGAIVNTSSVAAVLGNKGTASYTAAKTGLPGLTRVAAHEFGNRNIRVNAIMPGLIATPMVAGALTEKHRSAMEAQVPLRRMGQPEEIAAAALFLVSDDASYVTGAGLLADGGSSIA